MKETVPAEQGVTNRERPLPPRVQEALGDLVGAAHEGLMALSVSVGLGVLAELMEEDASEVVGLRGRHDTNRLTVRPGRQAGEVAFSVYRHFTEADPLSRIVLERMLVVKPPTASPVRWSTPGPGLDRPSCERSEASASMPATSSAVAKS